MGINTLALVLILIGQFSNTIAVQFTYVDKGCTDTGLSYTKGSVYENNLGQVLSDISSKSSSLKFYNYTIGDMPDEVYGLFQCRDDVSQDVCSQCVVDATNKITEECPLYGEAIVWYYECMLRYANRNIFSTPERLPGAKVWSTNSVTNYADFTPVLSTTMMSIIEKASTSSPHFASDEANFTLVEKLYTFAQCTPDIDAFDCRSCLQIAYTGMIQCCRASIEAALFTPSCQLRYDTTAPFLVDPQSSPSPLPTESPPPPPPSTVDHGTSRKNTSTKSGILGAIAAGVIVIAVFLSIVCWMCIRHKKPETISKERLIDDTSVKSDAESLKGTDCEDYSFAVLEAATEKFSQKNKLGEGAFGTVYKGKLKDGTELAIKKLAKSSGQGITQFMAEARVLGKLRHRNLVKLLGFCSVKDEKLDEKLLAYEFMPNGSLEGYLFDPDKRPLLDWITRYKIIKGVASGLQYLHEDSPYTVIHRDLKPDNILLDEKMNPKIADFGLAKLFDDDQQSAKTYLIMGTPGYMSPEYMNGGQYSNKSDVCAFGIMLLEIVSGQSNLKYYQNSGMGDLPSHAWRLWKEQQPSMFIDTALFDKNPSNDMVRCVQIGLLCTEPSPKKRPDMSSVIFMLSGSQKLPLPSSKPAFSFPPGFPRGKNHVASTSRVEDETNQSRFLKSISKMAQTSHPIPR